MFDESMIGNKKHIIITGMRGSGKTTLLKNITKQLEATAAIPGMITWAESRKAVYMCKKGSDKTVVIGEYDSKATGTENRMKIVYDGFATKGVEILDELINEDSEWITIDEIGYLESECKEYIAKLNEAFDRKRVIAVVRKQNIELLTDLCNRTDAYVICVDD